MAAVVGVISAIAGVASAVTQSRAAKKSREAQERAAKVQNRQAEIQRQRDIRQRLARARVLRAQVESAGFQSGAPGSSPQLGAQAGITGDVSSNIGFSNQMSGLEQARIGYLNQSAQAQTWGQQAGAIFGGIQSIAGMFRPT